MEDKLKILLCEDDENLGMLLREYLQAKGFVAELCPDGEVAEFCRPVMETGTHRTEWTTPDHIECLDKTDDPNATDNEVKVYYWPFGDRAVRSTR